MPLLRPQLAARLALPSVLRRVSRMYSKSHSHTHGHGVLHSHSHTQPNELLAQGFGSSPAVRITWIGLFVNVAMAGSKGVGGVVFHSQALVADAIHLLLDMVADLVTLATVNVATRPGSCGRFPLGYGKLELVGTFVVSGVLLAAGVLVGLAAVLLVLQHAAPEAYEYVQALQSHSHSHAPHTEQPSLNAAWLALALIGVKEALYRKTMAVATQTNSKVLVANAWHHRVDSLTAAVAFVTVLGSVLLDVAWLDAVGGVLVLVLIVHAGWGLFYEACLELVDRGARPGLEQYELVALAVQRAASAAGTGASVDIEARRLAVLGAGARTTVSVTLACPDVRLATLLQLRAAFETSMRLENKYLGRIFVEFEGADTTEAKEEKEEEKEKEEKEEETHEHVHRH